jgi:hypothetical protein
VLDTENGQLFIKGLRTDDPGVARQGREGMIKPHVLSLTPAFTSTGVVYEVPAEF